MSCHVTVSCFVTSRIVTNVVPCHVMLGHVLQYHDIYDMYSVKG